eukprot:Rhum_TRINITY_DN23241_c0_g1::Rhum_TRINITY_DN23241_c0_g1_i1::g.177476::m.177476/K06515/SLC44A1, CD92; solute carrier family 44 (choline transporter-like protein), member 1
MKAAHERAYNVDSAVGMKANRGCTDSLCLLLYLVACVGFSVMAVIAVEQGNPLRLLYGEDYLGNVCGKTGKTDSPRQPFNDTEWQRRDLLWYPFEEGLADFSTALHMGLCVAECPTKGASVTRYDDSAPPNNATGALPGAYEVAYNSHAKLRRCMPDRNNTAFAGKIGDIINLIDVSGFVYEGAAEMRAAQETIAYSLSVALGTSIAWLVLCYCCAMPMVVLSGLGFVGACGIVGKLVYTSDYAHAHVYGIAIWVVGGLFLCLFVCMIGRIVRGARIASESSAMLLTSPTVMLVPLLFTGLLVAWICVGVVGVLYVETMKTRDTQKFDWAGSQVQMAVQKIPHSRGLFMGCHLFFFLWTAMFILDTSYLSTAMAASFWYFSGDGDGEKRLPLCSPVLAVLKTIRYHLGTTVFGSLVIALCKLLRWVLTRMQKLAEGEGEAGCALKVLCCCMCCLEKCLKFLTEKAYVMTAIEGRNFISAASRAVALVVANLAIVAVAEVIGAFIVIMAKLLVVGTTVLFAYACLEKWNVSPDVDDRWVVIVVIAVLAYILCSMIVHVYGTVIDALVLCHCVDKEVNQNPRYSDSSTLKLLPPPERGVQHQRLATYS